MPHDPNFGWQPVPQKASLEPLFHTNGPGLVKRAMTANSMIGKLVPEVELTAAIPGRATVPTCAAAGAVSGYLAWLQ